MSSDRVEALSFALGDEWYCVDLERVANVLDDVDITRVEQGPDYVLGTAPYDGGRLLVMDVAVLFGNGPPPGEQREIDTCDVVVFQSTTGDQVNAWVVDRADETVTFDPADVVEPNTSVTLVRGLVTIDGRPTTWVDAEGINP